MKNLKCIFTFLVINYLLLIVHPVFADEDCLYYKSLPTIGLVVPEWTKSVVQPLKPMNLLHGNVAATYIENYELFAESVAVEDGFCVVLHGIDATIGYNDFLVSIDARHLPESCGYNVTLNHEDEHIRAHLTTIDEMTPEIRESIKDAANAVLPVFVRTQAEADSALDKINKEINENPNIILMRQKIQANQELRNKKIDQGEDSSRINACINE